MFTITIHLQSDDLALLEPLARHLGHIEVAIDSPVEPQRVPHPAVALIDQADQERIAARKAKITASQAKARDYRAEREAARAKREQAHARNGMAQAIIDSTICPTCHSGMSRACVSPKGSDYGRTGHIHTERRMAFTNQQKETS